MAVIQTEITNLETIILCGGQGSRLGSLTSNKQKCILEVNGKPFLQYIIDQLISFGISNFIFATGKNSEQIEEYFSSMGIISKEEYPLGTGGAIKNAFKLCKSSRVLIVNGDSFCFLKPKDFINFYNAYRLGTPLIMVIKDDNAILSSKFKTDINNYYGAGFYILPEWCIEIMHNKCSLEHDCIPNWEFKNYFVLDNCNLIDIGIKENFEKAKLLLR